jgi:hypothetical protein
MSEEGRKNRKRSLAKRRGVEVGKKRNGRGVVEGKERLVGPE